VITKDWHGSVQKDFLLKLLVSESNTARMPEKQASFIKDMRTAYQSRRDAEDLGLPLWQPTAKQLNFLNDIYETVRL
jgi:hypothetical protein